MRLEPHSRQSDWVALAAVICGLAPLPLTVLGLVPLVGCLSGPATLACVPAAIGFGVAGIVRARTQPEPNYVLPITGLLLGLVWLAGMGGGLYFLIKGENFKFPDLRFH